MEESRDVKKANLPLIVLGAIAAVLAIVLAYVWFTNYKLVGQLNEEKEELTQQMISLREDYDTLSSDYDEINAQLDSSREQVNQLIERLKETEARDRAKIRKYEKELGTLRSIMRNYIVQIDSLNTLNKKLTADAAAARREAEVSKARSEELSQKVEHLSGQVAAGSVIKARGLVIEPYDGSGKVNERVHRHAAEQNRQLSDKVRRRVTFAHGLHVRHDMVEHLEQDDGQKQHDARDDEGLAEIIAVFVVHPAFRPGPERAEPRKPEKDPA